MQSFNDSERMPLPRDENRFRFFHPNGKPVLPPNSTGLLAVKTTYERVTERDAASKRAAAAK